MQHQLTGAQPKSINWEKGVFESNGIYYYVNIESMCFERMKRFAELLPVVVYGKKYHDMAMFIHELRMDMMSGGSDFKETYFRVCTQLTNWDQFLLDNAGEYTEAYMDDILRFCALMIVTKDEDCTKLNDVHIEEKINNWKKDCNIMDFFFFAKVQTPRYKELLQTLSMEAQTNGGRLIPETKLPETRPKGQQD